MYLAELIGGLLAHVLSPIVIIPAIFVGSIATSWRALFISVAVTLIAVLATKIPAIARVAQDLGIPERSYLETTAWYAAAILTWVGFILLLRRVISGQWPIARN